MTRSLRNSLTIALLRVLLLYLLVLCCTSLITVGAQQVPDATPEDNQPAVDIEPLIPDGNLLDKETWLELVGSFRDKAIDYAPRLLGALIVFVLFILIGWTVSRSLASVLRRTPADDALSSIASRLAFYTVLVLGLIMAAAQAGLEVGSLLAGVGVVGLAVGLAAQESLSNILAGVTILWEQPFRTGDWVDIVGEYGEVTSINLRTTVVTTPQGLATILPNRQVVQSVIVNHTAQRQIRLDIPVGIAYQEDSREARRVLLEATSAIEGLSASPEPAVVVTELADSSVNLELRVWITDSRNERSLRVELVESVKIALDEAGIEIPFPQRTLHLPDLPALQGADKQAGQVPGKKAG